MLHTPPDFLQWFDEFSKNHQIAAENRPAFNVLFLRPIFKGLQHHFFGFFHLLGARLEHAHMHFDHPVVKMFIIFDICFTLGILCMYTCTK